MCGIVGVFGPFTGNDISRKVEKMRAEIHHRRLELQADQVKP